MMLDPRFDSFIYFDSIFTIIFVIMFVTISGVFVFAIVKGISQWDKNNNSPMLTVEATLIAKRTNVDTHRTGTGDDIGHYSSSTDYYVTFQVESGDRIEFQVNGNEYGLLLEGDVGKLTFQGTRYKEFERK